jgi:acetyl-CoA carboxylase alpha subunit
MILKDALLEELKSLQKLKPEKLIERRIEKFCKMGAWNE